MKYRCESFKLLLFRLLSSAIAKQPRNELFILQSDWKCFAFCCRINIARAQERKSSLFLGDRGDKRQLRKSRIKVCKEEMYLALEATSKCDRFSGLNKLRRFNLSYYDLHTADAHIDLFELEVKRRAGQEEARNQNVKRTGIKIVTRRIGDLLESRSGAAKYLERRCERRQERKTGS